MFTGRDSIPVNIEVVLKMKIESLKMDLRLVYTVYDFDSEQKFCAMSKIIKIMLNLEIFDIQHDFRNFQNHSEIFVWSQMIISDLTEKDILVEFIGVSLKKKCN
jgi:hypothetical protein